MANLNVQLPTGKVIGRFIVEVADNDDPDQEPQLIPATGRIIIRSAIDYLTIDDPISGPFTTFRGPHIAVLDENGFLSTLNPDTNNPMYEGMTLWANDSDKLSVKGWTYTATFDLKTLTGRSLELPAITFEIATGETKDLSRVIPTPSSPGYGLPQAESAVLRAEAAAASAEQDAAMTISSGLVDANGDLILTRLDGASVNAGHVKGPAGGWENATILATDTILDEVVLPGTYLNPNANSHNSPTGSAGFLTVIYSPSGAILQEYTPYTYPNTILRRRRDGGSTWTSWKSFMSTRVDKSIGTRVLLDDGSTERMISGDTGTRKIVTADLLNGWAVDLEGLGVLLSREGNLVKLAIPSRGLTGANATSNSWLLLPPGFRKPAGLGNYGTVGYLYDGAGAPARLSFSFNELTLTARGLVQGMLQWHTNDPWPTTLPGTPA